MSPNPAGFTVLLVRALPYLQKTFHSIFVAGNATYNIPCRSVRLSVGPLHFAFFALLLLSKALLPLPKALLPLPKALLPLPKALLPLANRPRHWLSCIRPCFTFAIGQWS